ncbi:Uma2 family endonuclease [Cronbergia sp. UHCC 0137]|uniref:Uma2 family endonuclease n=1 Tax=Cronbergia sp. UHCC 0137 TaxID=3110239 RepID=UPI002B220196|nr:Uma2 family endonuclease [Cronbergia sp. UHCC 0137]MEA5617937.1 Uma2 family endonuclease [Cronbergia sp. UHCC 0137]
MTVAEELPNRDHMFPSGALYSDEPPFESDLHRLQMTLLIECLELWWQDRNDFYVTGNLKVFYSRTQPTSEQFRNPDFLVVLDTERKPRRSWAVWKEFGKYPNVIIELLSNFTAHIDKGLKKEIYQNTFRVIEYFWFDPCTLEIAGFSLVGGVYKDMKPNDRGWFWSKQLELFLGIDAGKLRYFTSDGQLVPTQAEMLSQQKEQCDRLAGKLRELGVDPDAI